MVRKGGASCSLPWSPAVCPQKGGRTEVRATMVPEPWAPSFWCSWGTPLRAQAPMSRSPWDLGPETWRPGTLRLPLLPPPSLTRGPGLCPKFHMKLGRVSFRGRLLSAAPRGWRNDTCHLFFSEPPATLWWSIQIKLSATETRLVHAGPSPVCSRDLEFHSGVRAAALGPGTERTGAPAGPSLGRLPVRSWTGRSLRLRGRRLQSFPLLPSPIRFSPPLSAAQELTRAHASAREKSNAGLTPRTYVFGIFGWKEAHSLKPTMGWTSHSDGFGLDLPHGSPGAPLAPSSPDHEAPVRRVRTPPPGPAPRGSRRPAHRQRGGRSVLPPPGTSRSHSVTRLSPNLRFLQPFPTAVPCAGKGKTPEPGKLGRGQPLRRQLLQWLLQWLLQRRRQRGDLQATAEGSGLRTGGQGSELAPRASRQAALGSRFTLGACGRVLPPRS